MQKQGRFSKWFSAFTTRFMQADVTTSSVVIAYYLLFSLFPLTIAVGNILPLFNIRPENIMPYIDILLPPSLQQALDPIITNLLTSASGGLLSISAVGVLWSASRSLSYLQKGMNKAYGVPKQKNFLIKRGISFLMVFLLILLMIAFILVFSVGQIVLDRLEAVVPGAGEVDDFLREIKWPVTLAAVFIMLLLLYRVMPDVKLRLRHVWPGAIFSTAGLMILTQLFTIYMRFSSRASSSYGTLGAFIILMLWLNACCVILLVGTVLNATVYEVREGPPQPEESKLDIFINEKMDTIQQKAEQHLADHQEKKQNTAKMKAVKKQELKEQKKEKSTRPKKKDKK